jgi:hypothetical protein
MHGVATLFGGCLLRIELDDAKQRFASGRSFLRCH